MKKCVLKLELEDGQDKRRAFKTVSTLSGIDEIAIDVKGKKLTVIGSVDPVSVVSKLGKKNWLADIISVGPAKEPDKKEESKKEEPNKDAAKEGKNDEPMKDAAVTKEESEPMVLYSYKAHYPSHMNMYYYGHHSMEENPNACVIC